MLRNESSAWRALALPPKPPLQMRGGAHKRVAMKEFILNEMGLAEMSRF